MVSALIDRALRAGNGDRRGAERGGAERAHQKTLRAQEMGGIALLSEAVTGDNGIEIEIEIRMENEMVRVDADEFEGAQEQQRVQELKDFVCLCESQCLCIFYDSRPRLDSRSFHRCFCQCFSLNFSEKANIIEITARDHAAASNKFISPENDSSISSKEPATDSSHHLRHSWARQANI